MKKLIVLLLIAAAPLCAQTSYKYCGFTGTGPDVFTTATSMDGATFTNTGGSWTTPSGGVNAPTCINYHGNWLAHVAAANDANNHQTAWFVGTLNPSTNVVTTIANVNWTSKIVGLNTIFAGEWYVGDGDSSVCSDLHLTIPGTTDSTYGGSWKTWETHPTDCTFTTWSDPVDMQVAGTQMYDSSVFKVSANKYVMLVTDLNGIGVFQQRIEMESATSFLGPYTQITTGDWAGWLASFGPQEGPYVYRLTNGKWRFMLETLNDHKMWYSDCNSGVDDFSTCSWGSLTEWTKDQVYRHGSVAVINPVNHGPVAVKGVKLKGAKW